MVRVSEKCCVPNCGKSRLDNVILHKFPNPANEPDRFRTWLYAIGGDILALETQRIHDYRKVCHTHFDKSHITWSDRLSAIAVPTLYLKGLATQRKSMEIENNLQQPSTSQGLPAQRVPLMEITQRHMNVVTDLPPQPSTSQDFGQPRNVCNKTSTGMKNTPIVSKGSKSIYTARFCTEASTLVKHIKKLQKTKDTVKLITPQGKASNVPSVSNWLRTLENLEYLKEQLFQSHNLKSLWLRHFNQDPLENFFGCVRSHGIRNNNPTCEHFDVAFASLLINNMNSIHSPGSNCERDNGRTFKSLNKIFFVNPVILNCAPTEVNFDHISDHILVGRSKKKKSIIMAQIEYVTGYILRKSRKIFKNYESCNSCLYDSSTGSEYIKLKEYREGKNYLSYPADRLVECFSNIQDVVTNILKSDSDMVNIKHYIKTVLCIVLDLNFINCINHKDALTNHIIDLSCRFFFK